MLKVSWKYLQADIFKSLFEASVVNGNFKVAISIL